MNSRVTEACHKDFYCEAGNHRAFLKCQTQCKDCRKECPMEKKPPFTVAEQKRMLFLLQKYLATSDRRPGDRGLKWDLTKCDDEARKLLASLGVKW